MKVLSIFLLAMFLLAPAQSTGAQDHNSKLVEAAKKEGMASKFDRLTKNFEEIF